MQLLSQPRNKRSLHSRSVHSSHSLSPPPVRCGTWMDRRFPECKALNEAYKKCFAAQPFRWGQADGNVEDKCEEFYDAFRECVESSLEKKAKP